MPGVSVAPNHGSDRQTASTKRVRSPVFNFSSSIPANHMYRRYCTTDVTMDGSQSPTSEAYLSTRRKSSDRATRESDSGKGTSRKDSDPHTDNRTSGYGSIPDIKVPDENVPMPRTVRTNNRATTLKDSTNRLCSPAKSDDSRSDSLSPTPTPSQSRSNSTGSISPVRRGSYRPPSQERLSPANGKSSPSKSPIERRTSFYAGRGPKGPSILDLLPDRLEAISPDRRRVTSGLELPTRLMRLRRRRSRMPESTPVASASVAAQMDSVNETSEIPLIDRFRRAANIVYVCVVLAKRGGQRTQRETINPFKNLTKENEGFGGLAFNPSFFKANRQQRLSEDAKRILTTKSCHRTEFDIRYVQIALRNIQSFAEYPVRMQQKLCKVGWLEAFEPNRCIIRQGHIAHGFYIILSGTVMVTVNDGENSRVVCFLKRGESFGELGILNNTKRASTVISRDCVELLSISTSDFEDIFMCQGGVKNVNDPDHHEFLDSLFFLKDWPIELLEKHPKECVFNFFKRGDVLVKDSNYSDWIYIVKSGSCCVLKKLKKVKPYIRKRLCGDDNGVLGLLEDINTHRENNKTKSLPDTIREEDEHSSSNDSNEAETSQESPRNGYLSNSELTTRKRRLTSTTKGVYLSTTINDKKDKKKKEKGKGYKKKAEDEAPIPENFVQEKRTLASDLDNAKRPQELTEADKNPEFVVLQTLEKGGIFGLAPLVFFDQPSLSLVSNGAECIMMRKKFYMDYTTEDIRRHLRRHVQPYPSNDELQKSLQDYMNWGEFKYQTLTSTVGTVSANRLLRQTFHR
ncbi:uncharacterized protein LOC144435182 [Glandiceps talaboti]